MVSYGLWAAVSSLALLFCPQSPLLAQPSATVRPRNPALSFARAARRRYSPALPNAFRPRLSPLPVLPFAHVTVRFNPPPIISSRRVLLLVCQIMRIKICFLILLLKYSLFFSFFFLPLPAVAKIIYQKIFNCSIEKTIYPKRKELTDCLDLVVVVMKRETFLFWFWFGFILKIISLLLLFMLFFLINHHVFISK